MNPVCSLNILSPINIKIVPPIISAQFFNIGPIFFPINTPVKHTKNVIIAIDVTTSIIDMFKNAKLTPTARASILVATDKTNKSFVLNH